jgi:uncharacterized DUF497 family protein
MTVFNDPLAMTRFDTHHSDEEERWVTLGLATGGALMLVVHTYSTIVNTLLKKDIELIEAGR